MLQRRLSGRTGRTFRTSWISPGWSGWRSRGTTSGTRHDKRWQIRILQLMFALENRHLDPRHTKWTWKVGWEWDSLDSTHLNWAERLSPHSVDWSFVKFILWMSNVWPGTSIIVLTVVLCFHCYAVTKVVFVVHSFWQSTTSAEIIKKLYIIINIVLVCWLEF